MGEALRKPRRPNRRLLIEPELGPGSRFVDLRADELVRQMSERLGRVSAFALEAEEMYDEVPEQSPRRQLTNLRRVAMRRPDRLVGDAAGDALNRSFWYDGKVFAALDNEQHVWASGAVPPTVDQALDWVFQQTGTVVPLADFLYADSYARLMADVQRGVYLGIHEAAGVPCYHLSFEQATIDWQIWIDAGKEPLPRKLVITYKTEDEVPQYLVTIRKWNLQAKLPDVWRQRRPDVLLLFPVRGIDDVGSRPGDQSAVDDGACARLGEMECGSDRGRLEAVRAVDLRRVVEPGLVVLRRCES